MHQACKLSTDVHSDCLVCSFGLYLSCWSLRTGELVWCLELLDAKAESIWVLLLSPLWSSPHTAGQSHTFPCSSIGSHLQGQSSLNFSSVCPSHGLQLCTNCCTTGFFPQGQSFRNRLLQILPTNLLQCGLLFPLGHRFCQEPVPA